jgi:hypothetical protein
MLKLVLLSVSIEPTGTPEVTINGHLFVEKASNVAMLYFDSETGDGNGSILGDGLFAVIHFPELTIYRCIFL